MTTIRHLLPLAAFALLVPTLAGAKMTPAQKCEIAKEKAAGKKYSCLLSAHATTVAGRTADPAKCTAAFTRAFASAEAAAAKAGGACPLVGDATTIERRIDAEQGGTVQLLAGEGRLHDNGDGTVSDAQTGLMWEKKSSDGSLHDQDNLYSWTSSGTAADGTLFTAFLAGLNSGSGFAGHTDWRIPTIAELETIIDVTEAAPAVAPAFNSGCVAACSVVTCSCTETFFYWSASSDRDPSFAWTEGFTIGESNSFVKTITDAARAVRGGV